MTVVPTNIDESDRMSWQDIIKADRPLKLNDYLDEERAEKDYNKDVHLHNIGAGKKMNDQLHAVQEILRDYMDKGEDADAKETLREILALKIFNVGSGNPMYEGSGAGASMRGQAHSGGY